MGVRKTSFDALASDEPLWDFVPAGTARVYSVACGSRRPCPASKIRVWVPSQRQCPPGNVGESTAGTLAAASVAWLWSRYGHRVNLAVFFQVTAVFLLVFVVQLLIYGFHELTEANIFPYSEPLHWATEPYGPDGQYGKYLTYLLVMMPLGWLIISTLKSHRAISHQGSTAQQS